MFLGGVARRLPIGHGRNTVQDSGPAVVVSDDGGKTWGTPIQVIPEENRKGWACEECDVAELPNGDLFWVFRRCVPEDGDKPLTNDAIRIGKG